MMHSRAAMLGCVQSGMQEQSCACSSGGHLVFSVSTFWPQGSVRGCVHLLDVEQDHKGLIRCWGVWIDRPPEST